MPRKAGKTFAVGKVGIVETRILSFYTVKRTVEVGCFDSDFRDEIAIYVRGERSGISLSWAREESLVNECRDGWFMLFEWSVGTCCSCLERSKSTVRLRRALEIV